MSGDAQWPAPGTIEMDRAQAVLRPHAYSDSVTWCVTPQGLRIAGQPIETNTGAPDTIGRIWTDYGPYIEAAALRFRTPVELILATIATESSGKMSALRCEPGYESDERTPHRVSVGLMQTLIATADEMRRAYLPGWTEPVTRADLCYAGTSIPLGTAYIHHQRATTQLDPPKVACAYNAGSLYYDHTRTNRWRMRQFPLGTSHHADRFIRWFNDCFLLWDRGIEPRTGWAVSYCRWLTR